MKDINLEVGMETSSSPPKNPLRKSMTIPNKKYQTLARTLG